LLSWKLLKSRVKSTLNLFDHWSNAGQTLVKGVAAQQMRVALLQEHPETV
jgi:hypothetical protein